MKRALILVSVVLLTLGFTSRKAEPYRIAFDLTSRDSLDQVAVTRWAGAIAKGNPDVQIEIIMYGKGFELVMPEKSKALPGVRELTANPRVSFKVCAAAMKNNNVEKSQLLPEALVVPDGIQELVVRQQEGWGYIKASVSR